MEPEINSLKWSKLFFWKIVNEQITSCKVPDELGPCYTASGYYFMVKPSLRSRLELLKIKVAAWVLLWSWSIIVEKFERFFWLSHFFQSSLVQYFTKFYLQQGFSNFFAGDPYNYWLQRQLTILFDVKYFVK